MDIVLWIIIVMLFLLSFAGILIPIIPSSLFMWGGFLLYHFLGNAHKLNMVFWLSMGILTVIMIFADIISNRYFVRKFGGSKWGERAAAAAVIAGAFVFPPFGIILLPFLVVFAVEVLRKRTAKAAAYAAAGSLIGFLGGAFAKLVIQTWMIIWFIIEAMI